MASLTHLKLWNNNVVHVLKQSIAMLTSKACNR